MHVGGIAETLNYGVSVKETQIIEPWYRVMQRSAEGYLHLHLRT